MKRSPLMCAMLVCVLPTLGKPTPPEVPAAKTSEATVPHGYKIEILVRDLTYPTSIAFGPDGGIYVAESGYAFGDAEAEARILRINRQGETVAAASNGLVGPVNDLLWHDGFLYVSHRGKISVLKEDGSITDLVTGLPSEGDHHNNQLSAGPDGKIYFGQGTMTNSGIVGPDNAKMGWLEKHRKAHDIPARDIKLRDRIFTSKNPLSDDAGMAKTRAFEAFNRPGDEMVAKGSAKAGGTVLKMNPDGSDIEVHAWGLRNPYGVLWLPDGRLLVTENGMDVRGSRPVANDKEDLYQIKENAWYGWPDFVSGKPVTDPEFAPDKGPPPEFLMAEHPPVEQPLMTFPKHSAAAKMAWCSNAKFGRKDRLFIAFFGHMSPMTGKTEKHGGHRVIAVNLENGEQETFFGSKGHGGDHEKSGGEEGHHADSGETGGETATAGPRRLIDVEFGPDGALYIVDFGTLVVKEGEPVPVRGTGLIWKVSRDANAAPEPEHAHDRSH